MGLSFGILGSGLKHPPEHGSRRAISHSIVPKLAGCEYPPTAFGLPIVPYPEPIDELIRYRISGANKRQFLQISNSTTQKRITTALVASEGQYMEVLLPKSVTTARTTPDIKLQNAQANYLLASIRKGALRQADLASRSDVLSAERLLQDKVSDPFAACVGA